MELKRMRRTAYIAFYILLLLCFSCEEQGWITMCKDCTALEPETATLDFRLTFADGQPVKLDVYEGDLEAGLLYKSVETRVSEFTMNVSLNKRYTVTATYVIGGITYVAVDSAYPRVRYTESQCDDPCYFVYDRIVNLRLKYLADK